MVLMSTSNQGLQRKLLYLEGSAFSNFMESKTPLQLYNETIPFTDSDKYVGIQIQVNLHKHYLTLRSESQKHRRSRLASRKGQNQDCRIQEDPGKGRKQEEEKAGKAGSFTKSGFEATKGQNGWNHTFRSNKAAGLAGNRSRTANRLSSEAKLV